MSTNPFFQQEHTCSVCDNKFLVTRLKSSAYGVKNRHSDFYIEYEGVNPMLYEVWVCPKCYYASTHRDFAQDFPQKEKLRLNKALSIFSKNPEPDFSGERTYELAHRTFELAIRTCQIRQCRAGQIAPLMLKAGWLCRLMENPEQELVFLQEAKKFYLKAFEVEGTQGGKLSEVGLLYLIGELHRRTGAYREAVSWFSRAVSHPKAKDEPEIKRLARDQWQEAKASYIKYGGEEELISPAEIVLETSAPPQEKKVFTQPLTRNKVKIFASLYEDQAKWLQQLGNSIYAENKVTITKEEILRALLEVLMTLDLDLKEATSEEEVVALLKNQIKGKRDCPGTQEEI